MQKELKCPKCGGTHIVRDDCYSIIKGENITTIKELRLCDGGYCEDCGTDLQWDIVYQFIGYDAIEES